MLGRRRGAEAEGRKVRAGDLRVSGADRTDALRRLDVHAKMGHLSEGDARLRKSHVEASDTRSEIAKVFVDLPALPDRAPSIERRISQADRDAACDLLEKAHAEGRIEDGEYAAAKAQVRAARTRSELDAAFHGLRSPTHDAALKTASEVTKKAAEATTRVVSEGGRRIGRSFRYGVLTIGALMLGTILLIAGVGAPALVCFLGAVFFFVSAAISLVTSQSTT